MNQQPRQLTRRVKIGADERSPINGLKQSYPVANIVGIVIRGNDGNDTITLSSSVKIGGILDGGLGDDILTGSAAVFPRAVFTRYWSSCQGSAVCLAMPDRESGVWRAAHGSALSQTVAPLPP
ncbi:MAG: hypothetical protein O3C40_34920, partial [Planctomycetota bacterium]|nr:hypothetical protein [Planctomycetota bacterium]